MLVHIAIYKWKEGTEKKTIESYLHDVKSLEDKVPGIAAIYCGENISIWAKGFTHGIVVVARNQIALNKYRSHPDHQDVADKIERIELDGIGVDFNSI